MATPSKTPTIETHEFEVQNKKFDPNYENITAELNKFVGEKEIITFAQISEPGIFPARFLAITRKWS
jgi:hypothetical protein